MLELDYICDCGSLAIGNDKFVALYGNGYGYGKHKVFVDYDSTLENELNKNENWGFVTVLECLQETNIYYHDCKPFKNVIYKLKAGRYALYKNNGDMAIIFWEGY